jgi:hypothetical protein
MKPYLIVFLSVLLFSNKVFAETDSSLLSRIEGLRQGDNWFLSIDAMEITVHHLDIPFDKKKIVKKLKRYPISESELAGTDPSISSRNYFLQKSIDAADGFVMEASYYFIETGDKKVTGIVINAINKREPEVEKILVRLVMDGKITASMLSSMNTDTVLFSGRKLYLGRNCVWRNVNTIQCSGHGEMNWSTHASLESAQAAILNQEKQNKSKKTYKSIKEENVQVIFEGNNEMAKRIVYDIKGVGSALAGMTGGKTLTVYYVAAPVRGNYVSCVLSHWNNDIIEPSGLPGLLAEVMELKK